jgi:hypothetical protein
MDAAQESQTRAVGYAIVAVLRECGIDHVPLVYGRAVERQRALAQIFSPYERPVHPAHDLSLWHTPRAFVNVPPDERLVAEETCPWRHLEAAKLLDFPSRIHGVVSTTHLAAVERAVEAGESLEQIRDAACEEWESIARSLSDLETTIRGYISPDISPIMRNSGIAMIAASIEAFDYPNPQIPYKLFRGFDAAGDGSAAEPGVSDSGTLRASRGKQARYSLAALHAGRAPEVTAEGEMDDGLAPSDDELHPEVTFQDSSTAWYHNLSGKIRRSAEKAARKAGLTMAELKAAAAADSSRPPKKGEQGRVEALLSTIRNKDARERLQSLCTVETKSMAETRTAVPTMGPPMRSGKYEQWASSCGGVGQVRPAWRHAIEQGTNPDGSPKHRCIDDYRRNGVKLCTRTPEEPDLPSVLWIAWIATAIMTSAIRIQRLRPRLSITLEDWKTAYRMVPQRLNAVRVVAWYCFRLGAVVFQVIYGHSYGQLGAVYNFPVVPHLVCYVLAVVFLVMARDYVDDFMLIDLFMTGESGSKCMRVVCRGYGFDTDDVKRLRAADAHVALGAFTEVGEAHETGDVTFQPAPKKISKLLKGLRSCRDAKRLTHTHGASFAGKIRAHMGFTKGRAGAAAAQPFQDRGGDETTTEWTQPMEHALQFIELLFEDGRTPKLRVPVVPRRERRPLVLYTDASFMWTLLPNGEYFPLAFICAWWYDQEDGDEQTRWVLVPFDYYSNFVGDLESYIARVELLAPLAAVYSEPATFAGRQVIHFCDNTNATSALVHGYARKEDMARMVNAFHVAAIALDIDFYHEWCPSKANCSDIPTRPDRLHEIPEHVGRGTLRLPPIDGEIDGLRRWRDQMDIISEEARQRPHDESE